MRKMSMMLLAMLCLMGPAVGIAEDLDPASPTAQPAQEDDAWAFPNTSGQRPVVSITPIVPATPTVPNGTAAPASKPNAAVTAEPEEEAKEKPEEKPEVGLARDEAVVETAAQHVAVTDPDLTLSIEAKDARIEENRTLTLTITAGNPRAVETPVTLTLNLPERLACAQETVWEATLPAAAVDEHGNAIPSETTFTREVKLVSGDISEQVTLGVEMAMGTRFYRAQMPVELCVSDVRVAASAKGVQNGRVQPGDAFEYRIEITNSGMAARDVSVELSLPEGVELADGLTKGFTSADGSVKGVVHAEPAAKMGTKVQPSAVTVTVPVCVSEDVLEGDEDALALLTGTLRIDGEKVAMPRVQVCGPRITARLLAETDELKTGERMNLRIVVANAGLAPADVRVSCVLPSGLTVVREETDTAENAEEATPAEAALSGQDGGTVQAAANVPAEGEALEDGTLVFTLHMDAASEESGSVIANTRIIDVPVQAEAPQQALKEQFVGAALAWSTQEGTKLSEAVAVRVYKPTFLGITTDEWGGIFWAAVLLVITVTCLYAAVRMDSDKDEYVFD